MATDLLCPDVQTLERLVLGQIAEPEATTLGEHLLCCTRCATLLQSLAAKDALVEAMRQAPAATAELPHGQAVEDLAERLCRLRPAETPLAEGATPLPFPGAPPVREETEEPIDFLLPAGGPGEMGRLGPYAVLKVLGRGGMGVVLLARHGELKRLVALKMIATGPLAGPERLARFRREAEVVARLHHPNIVPIHEVGDHQGRPWFAMEYVAGGNLAQRLAKGPLTARVAAQLAEALAQAVQAAHEQGVVHRDLKPANVLLQEETTKHTKNTKEETREEQKAGSEEATPSDAASSSFRVFRVFRGSLTPKISDFGLAKQLHDDATAPSYETRSGALLGTPSYMAPEQTTGRNQDVGPAADVYALGAILYECLTGRPPFQAATPLETLDQVRNQEPVPPGRLQPGLPRDLETICLKCLQKEPTKRYASAHNLADDLGRSLKGEPIHARPVSTAERLRKWARRKPTAAALVAVSGLSLLALALGGTAFTFHLRAALQRAEAGEKEARKQQRRADAQYRAARDTLRQILDRLKQKGAADIPRLKELQQAQVEDALAFYLKAVEELDDPDPAVRLDVALALYEAATLQQLLGRHKPAVDNLHQAVALLERLVAEFPVAPKYRGHLADCFNNLANAYGELGRKDLWEDYHRKALDLRQELAAAQPDVAAWQSDLAMSYQNLGALYQKTGREPQDYYEKALAINRELVRRHPENARYALGAANQCTNLVTCYQRSGQPEKAEEVFREVERLMEPLARAHPEEPVYANTLASAYINWSMLLLNTGKPKEAVERATLAIQTLEAILRREPNYGPTRGRLLPAHGNRAQAYAAMERYTESVKDWDRVVELSEGAAQRSLSRVQRAEILAKAGDHRRAAAEAEELLPETPGKGLYLAHFAWVYANCLAAVRSDKALSSHEQAALAERYAARAVALLADAQAAGYFKDPAKRDALKTPRYDPLREREDYQNLVRKLETEPK